MGETSILSNDDSGNGNLLCAQQVVLTKGATLQSLSFYVSTLSGQLRLGIYSDSGGSPQTLLAQTAGFTPVTGWNTVNVGSPVYLTAGTYWLAYLPQNSNLHYRITTSGSAQYFSFPFGALPASFSTAAAQGSLHWSFYANLLIGTTPTTLPSPTRSLTPTLTLPATNTPISTTKTLTPSPTNTPISPTKTVTSGPTNTPPATATKTPTLPATATQVPTVSGNIGPLYPLKDSANGRYLVDQNNTPFLISGDSPHGLFGDLSLTDAETYLVGAQTNGINAIWVELLCSNYSSICPNYTTYDGIAPFSWTGSDPNTFSLDAPNQAYFSRMDAMLNLAAKYQITVFLDPIETGGWLQVLRNNGATKDYNYGVFLGNRYKNFPNIVWLHGNDFQTWTTPSDDAVVQAVVNGIQSVDKNHIQTVELDYNSSDSLEDPGWAPIISLNSAYSYYPEYDRMLTAYNRTVNGKPVPAYFLEGVYEFQSYTGGYSGPYELRTQEYWVMLSGASGQLYGNANLYPFPGGWQSSGWQTTPGITQFKVMTDFFKSLPWYSLVPDQNHTVVTAGYGTYDTAGIGNTSDYLTAARSPDGSWVAAYLPTLRTFTVDMTKLSGAVTARWFDPSNGAYTAITGSPFPNTGSRQFTPTGNNNAGDGDWVLVLKGNSQGLTTTPTPTNANVSTITPPPTATKTPAATQTPTPALPNTPTPAATLTPTLSTELNIGETTILSNDDYGNGGLLVAQQVVLAQNATLQSLSFYVTSSAGRLRLGLYSDSGNNPKTLLAQTAEFTPGTGWATQAVVTPVQLTAGTYWLAYLAESSNLHFRNTTAGTARWYSYAYGALPVAFGSSLQSGTYHWSFYGTLLPN